MYKIIDIYWERSNLHIIFDNIITEDVYLLRQTEEIKLDVVNDNEICINITNINGKMLNAATWALISEYRDLVVSEEVVEKLNDKTRNFIYGKERYAYLVNLSIDSEMHLKITTRFMMVNYKPQKFYRLAAAKTLFGKIGIIAKRIGVVIFNVYYKIIRFFRKNKQSILFLTENSYEINSNLKIMYKYMKNYNYKIRVFAHNKFGEGKKNIVTYIKEATVIAVSDVIFIDNYTPLLSHLKLNKDVKLVQLWHAGVGFKSVGYARFGLTGSPHPYISCHRNYTDVFVDQEKLIKVYEEVFGCRKEVFKAFGMPRLDGYLNKERIKEKSEYLYRINPMLKDNKIILFSPTYRGAGSNTAYYDYSLIDLSKIYDFCKKYNFIFIVKMHPFIKDKINIDKEYRDRIYDYSSIDINDLIYISDVMITDYSSCAYEFSLFNRPLIFYRFDKVLYEYERPMHTVDTFTDKQFEVKTFDELISVLEELKNELPTDRFANINKISNKNICEKIKNEVMGD